MAATAAVDESREYLCFWFSLLLLTLLSHFHLFGDLNETKIRETSGNDKKWVDCGQRILRTI